MISGKRAIHAGQLGNDFVTEIGKDMLMRYGAKCGFPFGPVIHLSVQGDAKCSSRILRNGALVFSENRDLLVLE